MVQTEGAKTSKTGQGGEETMNELVHVTSMRYFFAVEQAYSKI